MSAGAVRQREKRYRANGIPLKEMEYTESWEWLAEHAKELEPKIDQIKPQKSQLSPIFNCFQKVFRDNTKAQTMKRTFNEEGDHESTAIQTVP
jgi:hypothetical protein